MYHDNMQVLWEHKGAPTLEYIDHAALPTPQVSWQLWTTNCYVNVKN